MTIGCLRCKTVFGYEESDIRNPRCGFCTKVWKDIAYVECPTCKNLIPVRTDRKSQDKNLQES